MQGRWAPKFSFLNPGGIPILVFTYTHKLRRRNSSDLHPQVDKVLPDKDEPCSGPVLPPVDNLNWPPASMSISFLLFSLGSEEDR